MTVSSIAHTMTDENIIVLTPDMLGEMDAVAGYPFAPEMFFADRAKQTLYAAGWASVKGSSYLTDAYLLGEEVESIEDDYQWIARGC